MGRRHPLFRLVLAVAFIALPATPLQAQASPSRSWKVEVRAPDNGTEQVWPHDPNLTLELRPEGIRLLRSERTLVDIHGKDVIGVIYDKAVYRPVVAYFKSGGSDVALEGLNLPEEIAEAGPLGVVLLPAFVALYVVVPAVVLAPFSNTQHFVSIVWREGDRARNVLLQVRDDEREEILTAVSGATGVAWRDLPAERERLGAEIAAAAHEGFPIRLERDVVLADTPLEAGRYHGLILQHEGDQPDLLLFRGRKVKARNLVVRTPVTIHTSEAPVEAATVTYEQRPIGLTLGTMRTGHHRIEFPEYRAPEIGLAPAQKVAGGSVRFEAGKYALAEVKRTTQAEEPAFLFRVLNVSFLSRSSGDFFVTPTGIVYEPESLVDRFTAPRSDLRNVDVKSKLGGGYLGLEHAGNSYSFRMISKPPSPVGRFEQTRHAKRITQTEIRVATFAHLAIEDFEAASKQFEAWLAEGGLVTIAEDAPAPDRAD